MLIPFQILKNGDASKHDYDRVQLNGSNDKLQISIQKLEIQLQPSKAQKLLYRICTQVKLVSDS